MTKGTCKFPKHTCLREINFLKIAGISLLLFCTTSQITVADSYEKNAVTATQQSKTEKITGKIVDESGAAIIGTKRLWTSSMTLFSGGLCFLLMGAFYYRIDYKGHSRRLNWLKIYGMNSITAYILGEVINFRCIAASVSYGLKQYLGGYYQVWLSLTNYLIVFLILRIMYRQKIFLKIRVERSEVSAICRIIAQKETE